LKNMSRFSEDAEDFMKTNVRYPFVEQIISLLQQRGAARTDYAGTMLRKHLQEF